MTWQIKYSYNYKGWLVKTINKDQKRETSVSYIRLNYKILNNSTLNTILSVSWKHSKTHMLNIRRKHPHQKININDSSSTIGI